MKPVRPNKTRVALLDAAARLFSAYGFRHTSMEAIAAEASVAKATAYAHFPNKEAVFAAVITTLGEAMHARAEAAAGRARSPEAAVLASLASKHLEMYALVHSSRHAAELLEAMNAVGGKESESAHALYVASLQKHLARCRHVGGRLAPRIATLLDRSADGLGAAAGSAGELERMLALLVGRVVG